MLTDIFRISSTPTFITKLISVC